MIWSFARAVIWLKRSALALERIAIAEEQRASLAYQSFNLAHPSPTRAIRKAEFGVANVAEDWNKAYLEAHPELMEDD
jgi:hypothetical protein